MKLENEAFLTGIWKNYEDLEESITMEELEQIVETMREVEHRQFKFAASLKGIDIDSDKETETEFDAVIKRADDRLKQEGYAPTRDDEARTLSRIGISIEKD